MYLEENLKLIKDSLLDIEILKRKNELLCQENVIKIAKLTSKIGTAEEKLELELKESGEKKAECKLGNTIFKKMPDRWSYIEAEIRKWIGTYNLEDSAKWKERYFKVTETLKKQVLKDDVIEGNKIPGVTHEPQDDKFSYTLKGK